MYINITVGSIIRVSSLYTQHGRRRILTFEFGRHIDTYFCNLEGHGSLNPLKMKLKNSGFWRNWYTGCPKKAFATDFSDFIT